MSVQTAASSPLERQFAYVTGKGGVGKTTVTASLALALAESGRRVLLATTEPEHYAPLLPAIQAKTDPVALPGANLWLVALEPMAAMQEYGRLRIRARMARHALFGNRYAQAFFSAVPGLPQWAVLGKAWYHTTEVEGGRARFDTVIFDAPATGHSLQMLRVPQVISEVAPAGLLRRDAEDANAMLHDPARCAVLVVTVPEVLPTNETEELVAGLRDGFGIEPAATIVNRVIPERFNAEQRRTLAGLSLAGSDPASSVLRLARSAAEREATQARCIDRLRMLGLPLFQLPLVADRRGESPADRCRALADYLRPTPRY